MARDKFDLTSKNHISVKFYRRKKIKKGLESKNLKFFEKKCKKIFEAKKIFFFSKNFFFHFFSKTEGSYIWAKSAQKSTPFNYLSGWKEKKWCFCLRMWFFCFLKKQFLIFLWLKSFHSAENNHIVLEFHGTKVKQL